MQYRSEVQMDFGTRKIAVQRAELRAVVLKFEL